MIRVVTTICLLVLQLSVLNSQLSTLLAQPVSTPMTAGRTADGITYFLPKVAFRVHLLIEKKVYEPGQFSHYAERYLRISGVRQEKEITHQLVGLQFSQYAVRDTSKCYSLRMKGSKLATTEVSLSDDGVLLAVNDKPMTVSAHEAFVAASQPALTDPRQFLGSEVRNAGSTAKMAELTMYQMEELQEHRQQLITGEADDMPQDEAQLKLMLREIDREYAALRTLFVGTERCDTTEQTLSFCPDKEVKRGVLFRISKKLGLVDKDDLAGVPYYMTIDVPEKVDSVKYPLAENKKNEGFYVNVPARTVLTLQREDQPLTTFEFLAPQFGFVELRSGQPFKHYLTHLQLHPLTGALVKEEADIPEKK